MAVIDCINVPRHRTRRGAAVIKQGLALGIGAALMASASPSWGQNDSAAPLNALHQALHLSPQQEGAWQMYRAHAATPGPAQDRRRAAAQMFPQLTAPQRLDLIAAEMKQELVDLDQQARALRAFYATLSPEQQKTFDLQTLPPANAQQQPG